MLFWNRFSFWSSPKWKNLKSPQKSLTFWIFALKIKKFCYDKWKLNFRPKISGVIGLSFRPECWPAKCLKNRVNFELNRRSQPTYFRAIFSMLGLFCYVMSVSNPSVILILKLFFSFETLYKQSIVAKWMNVFEGFVQNLVKIKMHTLHSVLFEHFCSQYRQYLTNSQLYEFWPFWPIFSRVGFRRF